MKLSRRNSSHWNVLLRKISGHESKRVICVGPSARTDNTQETDGVRGESQIEENLLLRYKMTNL